MFGNLYLKWSVCLSYVDISFHIECYIDFCISFLCHVFRSYSIYVFRDKNTVRTSNIILVPESFLQLPRQRSS
jgi:hypothetical protein